MAEAIVEHDYAAKQPDELTIRKGDVIREVVKKQAGWCEGLLDGRRGLFPDNFVLPPPTTTTAVKMRQQAARRCRVVYSYKQEHDDELTLHLGDVVEVVGEEEEGWWKGRVHGKVGVFPSNFVEEIFEPNGNDAKDVKDVKETQDDVPDTKSTKMYCEVKYAYAAQNSDELTLKEGDLVTLISKDGQDAGWWRGELDGKVGVFPDNFVALTERPEAAALAKPAATAAAAHRTAPPLVVAKKPAVPFKKSPSTPTTSLFTSLTKRIADTIDGGGGSKPTEAAAASRAFDDVERHPVLADPRAHRVKGPATRRPPSVALKDADGALNGDGGGGGDDERTIRPRGIDVPKPPWLDEMSKKMRLAEAATAPPPVDMARSMPSGGAFAKKPEKPEKPPKTSPPPPIADLAERLAALEAAMRRQRDEFASAIDELRGRLEVETDMRMLLQAELEKLQAAHV